MMCRNNNKKRSCTAYTTRPQSLNTYQASRSKSAREKEPESTAKMEWAVENMKGAII